MEWADEEAWMCGGGEIVCGEANHGWRGGWRGIEEGDGRTSSDMEERIAGAMDGRMRDA